MNIKERLAIIAKSPRENGQWAREALDEIIKLEREIAQLKMKSYMESTKERFRDSMEFSCNFEGSGALAGKIGDK